MNRKAKHALLLNDHDKIRNAPDNDNCLHSNKMKTAGCMFIIMLQLTCVSTSRECDGFCHNEGKCQSKHGGANVYCECLSGWIGRQCQYRSCGDFPCNNGGTCLRRTIDHDAVDLYCSCVDGYSGSHCEKAEHLSTTASMGSSVTTSTTHAPSAVRTCDKVSAISAFVDQKQVVHNLTLCRSGSHASSAAFVMNTCNVTTQTASWKQGSKVIDVCHGSTTLPTYTPVGQFVNGTYMDDLHGGNAGIFLGCEDDGTFKLGVQFCDSTPVIHHIGTTSTLNPDLYYIII